MSKSTKPHPKFLGYGVFTGVYWGRQIKNWQFETVVGIQPTRQACDGADRLITHCLSRETRKIYSTTKLNIGHHNSPHFVKASNLKRYV